MAHSEFGSQRNQTRYSVEAPLRRRSCPQQAPERRLSLLRARPGYNCRLWPQLNAPCRSRSCGCCLLGPCRLPGLSALALQGIFQLGLADPRRDPKTLQILFSLFSFDSRPFFAPLIASIECGSGRDEESRGGIARLIQIHFDDVGSRPTRLLDLSRTWS